MPDYIYYISYVLDKQSKRRNTHFLMLRSTQACYPSSCRDSSCMIAPTDSEIRKIIDALAFIDPPDCESIAEPSDNNIADDDSIGTESTDDDESEDVLPPPKPFYDRKAAQQPPQGLLSRSSSSQSLRNKAREFLQSKCMTQSMPTLQHGRSQHNRVIGSSLESSSSSRNGQVGLNRVAEFDVLLGDL